MHKTRSVNSGYVRNPCRLQPGSLCPGRVDVINRPDQLAIISATVTRRVIFMAEEGMWFAGIAIVAADIFG